MSTKNSKAARLLASAGALCTLLATNVVQAHISLERGGTHKSRYGEDEQKKGPCGRVGGTRGTDIYTYEPGETITVKVSEFVPHPGYFRFAFDDDGDDGFVSPASIKPVDPARKCPFNAADQCGKSDFYNNETVLPGMDNLEPHLANGMKTYTFEVTLPDVECDNCTLQIIQVMEDVNHGAYNVTDANPDGSLDDVYKQCIDIVLKRKAGGDANGATRAGKSDAGSPRGPEDSDDDESSAPTSSVQKRDGGKAARDDDDEEAAPAASDDGCSVVSHSPKSSAPALGMLLALGMLATRRRRLTR